MKHKILITIEGGLVQDIAGIPFGCEVEVRDYDVDHTENEALKEDEDGNKYIEIIHESSQECFHWNDINGGSCGLGFECQLHCGYFRPKYQCKGGLIYPIPITPELCVECKKTCANCCGGRE